MPAPRAQDPQDLPPVLLRYHDKPGMYGLKRYALDLRDALRAAGVEVRPSPGRIREVRVAGLAFGGLVTKRLSNLLPPLGRGLVHCADHHSLPTLGGADVVTVHDIIPTTHPDLVARAAAQAHDDERRIGRAVAAGARLVTPSAAVRDDLRRAYGVQAEQVTAIHHGIHTERFYPDPGPAPALKEGMLNVLVGMNADLRKRVDIVLQAAQGLPNVNVVHVGTGHAAPDVRRRLKALQPAADALRREGRYQRLGAVDDATLRRLYSSADVLAHPSVVDGFSLPPLEALACGGAVLPSDIPVHREVLGPAATFLPLEVDAWAEALDRLSRDPGQTRKGREARIAHAARFSWDAAARHYVEVYRAAASAAPKSA